MPDLTQLEARLDNLEKRVKELEARLVTGGDKPVDARGEWREDIIRGVVGQL